MYMKNVHPYIHHLTVLSFTKKILEVSNLCMLQLGLSHACSPLGQGAGTKTGGLKHLADCIAGARVQMQDIESLWQLEVDAGGAQFNCNSQHQHTPLTYAVAFGQEQIVEYLIRMKCNLEFTSSYPVICRYGKDVCEKVCPVAGCSSSGCVLPAGPCRM